MFVYFRSQARAKRFVRMLSPARPLRLRFQTWHGWIIKMSRYLNTSEFHPSLGPRQAHFCHTISNRLVSLIRVIRLIRQNTQNRPFVEARYSSSFPLARPMGPSWAPGPPEASGRFIRNVHHRDHLLGFSFTEIIGSSD